ncbi:Zinc finger, RING/FYVE/PHD-type [Pleurostoma richardsiae]|uniref:Zinc finger, RING/FYVE/PHD-type n=1 Tax=Pleurostoma richardsiae TaxID=41990 RepID=A0AA38RXD4_9PEZI|nr:Zinc finger, RING/FYVE/PHD-type [Pleurostoma richardsiae]
MSSPAQAGPSVPKEKKGVGKLLSRVKTVLKKADPSKRLSTLTSKAGPSTAPAPSEPVAAETTTKPEEPPFEGQRIPRSKIHEERARKLAEKFGLEIKPSEWHSTEGDALRVEKPIRMRVHRKCHLCNSTFGAAKECPKCGHTRCKQCTRSPPKRTEAEKIASRERRAAIIKERAENAPIIADWDISDKKIVLKRPGKAGGQELVHKKPRQRVRRTCHVCQKLFQSGNKTCSNCGHVRCTDCPRDPAKKDKYPYGYPGDEFGPNSIPYYNCHECGTRYPPNPDEGAECSNCSHKRCGDCKRLKPQRVEPEPDPEILKSIEAKLEALKLK